jgi:hypothetical protein
MTGDDLILLADGVAIGVDACLLVHFGGRIWDDFQDRRLLRRAAAKADAIQDRADALTSGEKQ